MLSQTFAGGAMDERMRIALAEAIGTAVLVIGGVGTAVIAGKQVGNQGIALAFGLSLLVMVYAIGPISGCHINPAVTVGLAIANKTKWVDVPWYVVAQLVGAVVGALLIFIIASGTRGFSAVTSGFGSNGYGRHSPGGYNIPAVAVSEILMTALLIFVILSSFHGKFPVGFGGIAIGLTLALIHLVSIQVDNTSVNPARSFGPALFQAHWALAELWAFIIFPLIGGVLGAFAYRFLIGEVAAAPTTETT
jgi:aquaporin Z